MPKFVCLLPVRDEADIVGQCLRHLLVWADAIYILDTGSVDQTWEIVLDWASNDKRVVPMFKESVYFSETRLRGYMFHVARQAMREGDWFLRVDADEFHHIAPPEFIRNELRRKETIVYHQYYDFRLLESEVQAWERGEETLADRSRPIEERRRFYTISAYSEPRLCRYRSTMRWPETVAFPFNAGYVARCRLPIRHYPHRDPPQLDRRCRLRAVMMADKENRQNWKLDFHYWQERNWRRFVTDDSLPDLRFWAPHEDLPRVSQTTHLKSGPLRIIQRLIHSPALPFLDRLRPAYSPRARPQPIAPAVVCELEHELQPLP